MKRGLLLIGTLLLIIVVGVLVNDYDKKRRLNLEHVIVASPTPTIIVTPTETVRENLYPITASFKIVTNGIVRNFSNAMYQNQSGMAFIPSGQPQTVTVTKESTWQEFFDTLPFSLDSECLVTGDGDTFCDGDGGELTFTLNGKVSPTALTDTIRSGDLLVVNFN